METTAGCIDEDQIPIGFGEDCRIEHVLRAVRQRDMDADKINCRDQS